MPAKAVSAKLPARIPTGDLQRILAIVRKTGAYLDEWDFIREAVRLRIDEFNVGYPNWLYTPKGR